MKSFSVITKLRRFSLYHIAPNCSGSFSSNRLLRPRFLLVQHVPHMLLTCAPGVYLTQPTPSSRLNDLPEWHFVTHFFFSCSQINFLFHIAWISCFLVSAIIEIIFIIFKPSMPKNTFFSCFYYFYGEWITAIILLGDGKTRPSFPLTTLTYFLYLKLSTLSVCLFSLFSLLLLLCIMYCVF